MTPQSPHPLDAHLDLIRRTAVSCMWENTAARVEIDEVVSECYLHLRERFHTYRPECGKLPAWVHRVTKRRAVEAIMALLGYRRHMEATEDGRQRRVFRCHQVALTHAQLNRAAA